MKKIMLIMIMSVMAMAFDVGSYKCGNINMYYVFDLKDDGSAKSALYTYPDTRIETKRGIGEIMETMLLS